MGGSYHGMYHICFILLTYKRWTIRTYYTYQRYPPRRPLSPYLFLLCSEGLHRLIQTAANNGDIKGVSICRNGPILTHVLFADDSLLFCTTTRHDCQKVLEILSTYERLSSQKLNKEKKTLFFFSKSTPLNMQSEIMVELGVTELKQYEAYLGLPALVGRNKRASFNKLK